jgi:hypothetical protein
MWEQDRSADHRFERMMFTQSWNGARTETRNTMHHQHV